MLDPRAVVPNSIMPSYPWLYGAAVDVPVVAEKLRVLKKLGIPYTDDQVRNAAKDYAAQAAMVVGSLMTQGKTDAADDAEIVALVAYLMRLGRNLEPAGGQAATIEGGK
jgi:cytochrome c oxidase cbb3-type subunit I/II